MAGGGKWRARRVVREAGLWFCGMSGECALCSYSHLWPPQATGLWFCAINYSVHAAMYFYYFLSITGGPLRSYARPLAPYITAVQLFQVR